MRIIRYFAAALIGAFALSVTLPALAQTASPAAPAKQETKKGKDKAAKKEKQSGDKGRSHGMEQGQKKGMDKPAKEKSKKS